MKARLLRLLTAGALLLPLLAVIVSMPGCNTVRGVGKDISNAGEDVEDTVFGDTRSHGYSATKRR